MALSILKKKLNYYYQQNKELNNDYKNISEKSNILIKSINDNNCEYNKVKKIYEEALRKNREFKQKFQNFLKKYKNGGGHVDPDGASGVDEGGGDEDEKIQNEEKMLLLTLQSKKNIVNNLESTLKILEEEINLQKNKFEKKKKILELKKILTDLNNKINDNKDIIVDLKEEKQRLITKKNLLIKNNFSFNNISSKSGGK